MKRKNGTTNAVLTAAVMGALLVAAPSFAG